VDRTIVCRALVFFFFVLPIHKFLDAGFCNRNAKLPGKITTLLTYTTLPHTVWKDCENEKKIFQLLIRKRK